MLKGDSVAKPKGGSKTKWLIGIGLAAAAVAAVAAWRKQQSADDPWATPLNDGTANRVGATSSSSSLKNKASDQVEQAKGAIGEGHRQGQGQGERPRRQGSVGPGRRQGPIRRADGRRDEQGRRPDR